MSFLCLLVYVCVVGLYCRRPQDGKMAAKPEFKNAKVALLYDTWQRVVQQSGERRRRLQQMLDRLNEVRLLSQFEPRTCTFTSEIRRNLDKLGEFNDDQAKIGEKAKKPGKIVDEKSWDLYWLGKFVFSRQLLILL